MKKIIALVLASVMMLTALAFTACTPEEEAPATLKLGLGLTTSASATDATAEENGEGAATTTAAAVLVDNDGKLVDLYNGARYSGGSVLITDDEVSMALGLVSGK
jgi:hypothetical protein